MLEVLLSVKRSKARTRGQAKRAKKYSSNVAVNAARPDILSPTLEYLAHPDGPERGAHGGYRVIDALERLFTRHLLDRKSETLNEAMYLAALKLRDLFQRAGLEHSGCGAIEMDRIIGGSGDPAHMMPTTEIMADARREFRHAMNAMGYYGEFDKPGYFPFRGSGRVVGAVVCAGTSVAEAAALHTGATGERADAIAMSKLRDGLVALVSLWRLVGRGEDLKVAVRGFRDFRPGDVMW